MILDLRTIFVTGALTCLLLGVMQLLAFATGRFTRWPAWWGLSSACIGTALLCTALRGSVPDMVSIEFANTTLIAGSMLLVFGVRAFGGHELPWFAFLILLATTWILLSLFPGEDGYATRVAIVALLLALCDAAMVREAIRLARKEKLRSAWILAGFFAPTVIVYLVRMVLALRNGVGTTLFPENAGPVSWLAAGGTAFLILRGNALVLLATERSGNLLAALAKRDPLTGAMNRAGLEQSLAELEGGRMAARRASLLLIDIDHFKRLNDTLGHATGDHLLRVFTHAVRTELRKTDILARQGGDEFAIVLPGVGIREAVRVAERIRQAFREALAAEEKLPVQPTLSIGVTEADLTTQKLDEILQRADEALYRAKRLGRDRVQTQTVETAG